MIKVSDLKKVNSIEDFEALGFDKPLCEISHRGGYFGYYNTEVSRLLDVPEDSISNKTGCYCNYLGGGIRGAVTGSGFSKSLTVEKRVLMQAYQDACIRVYVALENETGLNNDEYPDGDTNWDAQATAAARRAGTVSAY